MKKWLRIISIIACLVGLTSLLRIQAQQRGPVINKATLQDQTNRVAKTVTSHQPEDLQLALDLTLPAGETVITLAEQDQAKLEPGKLTDLEAVEDGQVDNITAEVDEKHRLMLNNDQEEAQQVKLLVPVKLTDPLLIAKFQLELRVADSTEEYKLRRIKVIADEDDEEAKKTKKRKTSKVVDNSRVAAQAAGSADKVTADDSQTTNNEKITATVEKVTPADDVPDKTEAKVKTTNNHDRSEKQASLPAIPTENGAIKINRAQVKSNNWSSDLLIGGSLLEHDGVKKITKELANTKPKGYYGTKNNYFDNYEHYYHSSYMQSDTATAYAISMDGEKEPKANDKLVIYYDNVGAYTDSPTESDLDQQMGVIVEISNIVFSDTIRGGRAYIDFPNNFYSGLVYNGIKSFTIDMTFTNSDWTKALEFPGKDQDGKYGTYFTFGSLNGYPGDLNEWAGTDSGLDAERVEGAFITPHPEGWYEGTGTGSPKGEETEETNWGDYLGSSDYELGAVSFPMTGVKQPFKLRSDFAFTWQSFSTAMLTPLKPPAPTKAVDKDDEFELENNDLDGVTIDRDEADQKTLVYTIYQPTYSIPDQTIAKPKSITMTDQLPAGLTVNAADIKLFNTDDQEVIIKAEDGEKIPGDITVSDTGLVTYKLSKAEIEELIFDGGSFAIRIRATVDDDFVGTFKNRAIVSFGPKWEQETNEVVTHYIRGTYQFQKIDGTTDKSLAGAEFIIENEFGQYLTFDDKGKFKDVVEDQSAATRLKGDENGNFKVTGLPYGKYTLIETQAPDGYVIGDAHDFEISKEQQDAAPDQIKNDPYTLPVTGGHGIFWFLAGGLILILISLSIWRTHPEGG
ncbi:SpaA isopeptide-forming pilin-related protein [Levilactobacillus lindianensis]|uniref:SpaA isopeptide-forming pilin-related protein n=1 Tax=Levilactobacillus lindianensis TaxID=2486018 RepID=UPI000F749239|nr:SpaA isopeptide-forming pilin-related protein [Levilactobacillus lindianensis]